MNELLTLMKSELVLTVLIFLLLFVKIGRGVRNEALLPIIQVLLLVNFIVGFFFNGEGSLFGGMFHTSSLIAFEKNILSLAVYLISLLFAGWLKKSQHMPEFFLLMLTALLGMFLMISSGNLLMFYLSLELSTIPVAAMANFDLDKKRSSEGAMKMILSSAFSSGILLFGISLVYGATGTLAFAEIPAQLNGAPLQVLAFVFLFSAFAFKLSVVPFHLWTADVYEGSPIAVTAFLSVVSKASMAFILITVLYQVFKPVQSIWYNMLVLLAMATMVAGNLFALRQQNIKRLFAFSSIAQVGFVLVGISSNSTLGVASVVYFMLIYVFSAMAALGVAAAVSHHAGQENIDGYKGLYKNNKFLSWAMALALFSLAGIPPTAGFFGKLFLLAAGGERGAYWFITVAALNMIVSLYYYLRVVRAIFMDANEKPIDIIPLGNTERLGLVICGAGIILVGLAGGIFNFIQTLH